MGNERHFGERFLFSSLGNNLRIGEEAETVNTRLLRTDESMFQLFVLLHFSTFANVLQRVDSGEFAPVTSRKQVTGYFNDIFSPYCDLDWLYKGSKPPAVENWGL